MKIATLDTARMVANYESSGQLVTDAIDQVAVARELPADLVDRVVCWYRTTDAYATKIDDALNGEVSW
jgi:hypothetical protein